MQTFHFLWLKILDVFSMGSCFRKIGEYPFCILIVLSKVCLEYKRYLLPVPI